MKQFSFNKKKDKLINSKFYQKKEKKSRNNNEQFSFQEENI